MIPEIQHTDHRVGRWLQSLKPSSTVFWRAELGTPWGLYIDDWDKAVFHIILEGTALLELDDQRERVGLEPGDLVLLPTGGAHALRDSPSSPLPKLEDVVRTCESEGKWARFGGNGAATLMLCGACHLGTPHVAPASQLLPRYVKYAFDPGMIRVVATEARGLKYGEEAVLVQLLTLLVLQALRAHLSSTTPSNRRALLTPAVGGVLAFIHDHLSEHVDLDDLCRHSALSRTVLSQRFRETLGVSPIQYLRRARLARAAELLRTSPSGLARIARTMGYSSASTFSRAFRRVYGVSPGEYRGDSNAK